MRHAPYSTFANAVPVQAAALRRTPGVLHEGMAFVVSLLTLPRRVAAIRRDMALLGAMGAHELSDIGLSRQDVWDAAALPIGQSPGSLLTARSAERRRAGRP